MEWLRYRGGLIKVNGNEGMYLIDLSPLTSLFLHEASVYSRHDLVEVLAAGPLALSLLQ
jgi:hypothetical protein